MKNIFYRYFFLIVGLPVIGSPALADAEPIVVLSANPQCQYLQPNNWLNFHPDKCTALYTPDSVNSSVSDPVAEVARQNASRVYQYFLKNHNWNSYDGKGSPLISIIHAGTNWTFAGWYPLGKFMVYGDGDGKIVRSLAFGSDVAAHEFTHGVATTLVGVFPPGDPGAINEAIADFFGVIITNNQTWNMGCGMFVPGVPCRPVRCLANPNNCGSANTAAHMAQKVASAPPCNLKNDFCGIHINSTILSHALYLMTRSLPREQVGKIVFEALRAHLRTDSGFPEAAEALRQSCRSLFDERACEIVNRSLMATGL